MKYANIEKEFETRTSVIIVTHNHREYLNKCLNSIPSNLEIIVVDNVSTDGTPHIIEEKYPHIKLIKSNKNLGYGRGVNLGVKNSSGDYLVVLNPDTIVQDNSIDELVKPLIKNEKIITIPKIMLYNGSRINTCGNVEHFTGLTFTRGLGKNKNYYNKEECLGGLSGACFALKRDIYQKIGGFDEDIFLYMEDAELSWKINSLGFKIQYIPDSVVYHDYKLDVPAEKIYHLEKGRYIILRKYFTWKLFLMFLPSIFVTELFTFGYASLKGINGLKFKIKAIKDVININIEKNDINRKQLIKSLDWKVPIDQLSHNIIDKLIKRAGNMIYFLNYFLISYFWIIMPTKIQKRNLNIELEANSTNKKDKKKIALICSHGGHLTEILCLLEAFQNQEIFFITYNNFRTKNLGYNKYLLENIGTNPFKMLKALLQMLKILYKEKPDTIISTGSEIAIPAFILAKFFRIKTIFIESWCRVKTKSGTGKIVYPLSDLFLVQWPELLEIYGKKAKYRGAVI